MPRELRDLQKGATVPGDCGAPHDVMPPWMDRDRFNRGREFFQRHLTGILLSQYMAVLVGFSFSPIQDVFVYTGKSSSAEQTMKRYVNTIRQVLLWHDGDVWDVNSKAHASVMKARNMHRQVARAITKDRKDNNTRNEPCIYKDCNSGGRVDSGRDRVFISQYDMGLTLSAFTGFVLLYPEKFGIFCTITELEDYSFFWRGIGYLVGIEDEYNICSGNYAETCQIIAQIENEIVKPGMQNPHNPKGYDVVTTTFVESINLYMKNRYLVTKDAMFSFAYDLMDVPMYKVSMGDWCRFIVMKWMVWLSERVPGLSGFANRLLVAVLKRENPE